MQNITFTLQKVGYLHPLLANDSTLKCNIQKITTTSLLFIYLQYFIVPKVS